MPVKLFMCVGGLERVDYLTNMKKMDELLRSRNYPNLKIESHIFENETHGTTVSASIGRGLKMLFKRWYFANEYQFIKLKLSYKDCFYSDEVLDRDTLTII